MMRADIVIVSHLPDLQWLLYNVQLLCKFWREPDSQIIVRLEEDCRAHVEQWAPNPRIHYRYVDSWGDGYTFQMYQKMIADDFTDAELIILVDSDAMLCQAASLVDLLENGKPIIYYLDWPKADPIAHKVWRGPTSRVMGMDLDRDYMVTMPFVFWRDTFSGTRRRIVNVTGQGFFESVYSETPFKAENFLQHPMRFADYEALGLYAAKCQADRYVVKERPKDKQWPWNLYWSHGGLSPTLETLFQSLL
jgi:hypothetical protein